MFALENAVIHLKINMMILAKILREKVRDVLIKTINVMFVERNPRG